MESDISTLSKLTASSGEILYLTTSLKTIEQKKIVKKIDKSLKELEPWMIQHNGNSFYIASEELLPRYNLILNLWNKAESLKTEDLVICWKESKSLIFSLKNMLILKQEKMRNIFYINLVVAMALILTLIFFTRSYIRRQLTKQAIYDIKTKLFSKEYLLATIKELSARVLRSKEPLTALYINLKLESSLSEDQKDKIVERVSVSLLDKLRASDIACRYSENEFVVLFPNTNIKKIEGFIDRVDNCFKELEHTFKIVEYLQNDTYEEFLEKII